jgi:hypothetical protein
MEQEIIKTAFEAGINMFDTAEAYASGKSEEEMRVLLLLGVGSVVHTHFYLQGTCNQGTWITPYRFSDQHQDLLGSSNGSERRRTFTKTVRGGSTDSRFSINRPNYLVSSRGSKNHWLVLGLTMLI